jgi:hydroxymethylbilane synthase
MKIILATRKSPLALTQTEMVAARLREMIPGAECELLKIVTTGGSASGMVFGQARRQGVVHRRTRASLAPRGGPRRGA